MLRQNTVTKRLYSLQYNSSLLFFFNVFLLDRDYDDYQYDEWGSEYNGKEIIKNATAMAMLNFSHSLCIYCPFLANFVILLPLLVLHAGFYFMLLFSFYLDDETACGDELFDELDHQVDVKEGKKVTVACPGGCIKLKMVSLF